MLREYLRILRKRWQTVVAIAMLAALVSIGYLLFQRPSYEATARAYVSTSSAETLSDLSQGTSYAQQVVKSYADIATSQVVLEPVISQLRLKDGAAALSKRITVTIPTSETILEISATDSSPARAAQIANAVTRQLTTTVLSLSPDNGDSAAVKVTQVDRAIAPSTSTAPPFITILGVALVVGVILGAAVAMVAEAVDTRIRTLADISGAIELPTIGVIPLETASNNNSSTGPQLEAYRTLRTNLQFVGIQDGGLRSVVVSSSLASEGKSTTTANLGVALSNAGMRVIVVDADLRRPKLATYLGVDGSLGLTDVVAKSVALDEAIQPAGGAGLDILPAGTLPPNPNELLQSPSMLKVMQELEQRYDFVLYDSPPLLPVSDAAVLARRAGGAILVSGIGLVKREQLRAAYAALGRAGARPVGVVATMVRQRDPEGYAYSYEYSTREMSNRKNLPEAERVRGNGRADVA